MTSSPRHKVLVIVGPTASGKSELALRLAMELDGEIVNADSMQVYRGMDIGTAKPDPQQRLTVPHHLIDVAAPDHPFSAADYAESAALAVSDIASRGKRPIVVGGTGLYIRALLNGLVDSPSGAGEIRQKLQDEARQLGNAAMLERLRRVDPDAAARMHPNNLVRIIRALEVHELTGAPLSRHQQRHGFSDSRFEARRIGIQVERSVLYRRIEERVEHMLTAGLLDEVRGLLAAGCDRSLKSMRAIGYKEAAAFLYGECSHADMVDLIKRDTRRYAKRQLTWFRGESDIIWLEYPEKFVSILEHAIDFFG